MCSVCARRNGVCASSRVAELGGVVVAGPRRMAPGLGEQPPYQVQPSGTPLRDLAEQGLVPAQVGLRFIESAEGGQRADPRAEQLVPREGRGGPALLRACRLEGGQHPTVVLPGLGEDDLLDPDLVGDDVRGPVGQGVTGAGQVVVRDVELPPVGGHGDRAGDASAALQACALPGARARAAAASMAAPSQSPTR